eukprot:7921579-Pyramimonas_sp.AAC.1
MTPLELHQCGFCEVASSAVVGPRNTDFTCDKGDGRLIDYAVVPRDLCQPVTMGADWSAAFKTHACLHVQLPLDVLCNAAMQ